MARISVDGLTVLVRGYYDNNGTPYFQIHVPKPLKPVYGCSKVAIPLLVDVQVSLAQQCQRLNQRYRSWFRGENNNKQCLKTLGHHWMAELCPQSSLSPSTPITLSEAFETYISNHRRGREERFKQAQEGHWNKVIHLVGDIALEQLTREHARRYREDRLNKGVKQPSVQREINTIKAIINSAIKELELEMKNPFEGLVVSAPSAAHEATRRLPYSKEELKTLLACSVQIDDAPRRAVILLALTGARLAEIVGLRRCDVNLNEGWIHITGHPSRSLKTPSSDRKVPLLPLALEAAKKQLEEHDSPYLFPTFCNDKTVKADSASSRLNKWATKIVPNRSMHCLRHTMRDLLREVGCPDSIAKQIGGWSKGADVSEGYGRGVSIVEMGKRMRAGYIFLED
jgi:integrase